MRKGFTLVELAVAILVISILSTVFISGLKPFIDKRKKEETLERFEKLAQALKYEMKVVMNWRKNHPDWVNWACGWGWHRYPPLLPPGCALEASDASALDVYTAGHDNEIIRLFRRAGCEIGGNFGGGYRFVCYDGWGNELHYEYGNWDNNQARPYNYNRDITITFISAGKDRTFGTSDDLRYTFSTAEINEELREQTVEQLRRIANALDAYFRKRLTVEITERVYPNGLSQADDLKVNWYLQLCTDHPYRECANSDCTNIDWGFPAVSSSLTHNTCDIGRVLGNLNLPPEYRTDSFGNPIYINLCYLSDTSLDGNHCHPPYRHDARGPFSATVSNGINTVVSEGE